MAKASKGGFYAVRAGHKPGVYTSWDDCSAQIKGFPAARHKKFPTRAEAEAFVRGEDQPIDAAGPPKASKSTTPQSKRVNGADGAGLPPAKRQKRALGGENGVQDITAPPNVLAGSPSKRRVYCDGSSRGNGKAIARILETDPHPEEPLTICSDSEYTISVFSKWIPNWKRRGWKTANGKTVANQDMIRYVLSLLALRAASSSSKSPLANITFQKVKAHVGIEGNEQADRFANNGAMLPEVPDRDFAAATKENEKKLKAKGASAQVDDVKWAVEVEEGDLLDESELRELEETQDF
ncbi:ribonuclease HI [Rhodotorula toruloides]|uniref:ribonuclease H n=1 Tax=Rhodotorula toruloides TaxID=5286 RepID=A0A511KH61_RHOTO|nr:ribonuclease HI [Rhodotorula toruloides]